MSERKYKRDKPKDNSLFGFGIGDCPIWIYRWFDSDVKELYQNKYWIKLLDLLRKAEAYEMLVQGQVFEQPVEEGSQEKEIEKEDDESGVMTMRGRIQ